MKTTQELCIETPAGYRDPWAIDTITITISGTRHRVELGTTATLCGIDATETDNSTKVNVCWEACNFR